MLIDERQQQFNNFSNFFFILPITTDHKEKTNQFINNVQPHPIDIDYNDFAIKYSPSKKYFNPSDLDSKNVETRLEAREVLEKFFKDVVKIWNANSRALMTTTKVDAENFVWITETDLQNNNSRFKLDSYFFF